MSEIQVASRYAKSLIDLAQEQNSVEQVKSDIDSFLRVVRANTQLKAILRNPIIGTDKKLGILTALFGDASKIVLSFFKIVVNKGRSEVLYATANEFLNEYNKRKGIIKAVVTSASPLSEANKEQIQQVIQQATQKTVILETKVDSGLIGGFVLNVGDKQFDASIASSLNKLRKEFSEKVAL
jgi:F-type H+-transporting ATPase subunit delta